MPQKNMIPLIILGCLLQIILLGGYYFFFMEPKEPVIRPESAVFAKGRMAHFVVHNKPKPLSDMSFLDADGDEVHLSDFRGKTILVNIWASWCGPCRSEMKSLDRLQEKLGSNDFEVVALNIDGSNVEKGMNFLDQIGADNLDFYADSRNNASRVLGSRAIPHTAILNPSGQEMGRLIGATNWSGSDAINLIQSLRDDPLLNGDNKL